MGNRRMFAKTIIGAGKFLKMPPTARLLYYDLGMAADDQGIVEAYTVMTTTRATEDDLRVLVAKGYVKVLNEELVTLICDWNENNYIRPDRLIPSIYNDLLCEVGTFEIPMSDTCQTVDGQLTDTCQPNVRISKDKISKDKLSKDKLSKDKLREDKKNQKAKTPVVYFPNDELLDDTLKEFVKMRKTIKAPMTDKAITLLIAKLEKLATLDGVFDNDLAVELLNTSIENSWKSIYPKDEKKPKTQNNQNSEWEKFFNDNQ